jgi:hypothetical protein
MKPARTAEAARLVDELLDGLEMDEEARERASSVLVTSLAEDTAALRTEPATPAEREAADALREIVRRIVATGDLQLAFARTSGASAVPMAEVASLVEPAIRRASQRSIQEEPASLRSLLREARAPTRASLLDGLALDKEGETRAASELALALAEEVIALSGMEAGTEAVAAVVLRQILRTYVSTGTLVEQFKVGGLPEEAAAAVAAVVALAIERATRTASPAGEAEPAGDKPAGNEPAGDKRVTFEDYIRLLDKLHIRGADRRRALSPLGVALGAEILAAGWVAHETPASEMIRQVFFIFVQTGFLPVEVPAGAGDEEADRELVAQALGRARAVAPDAYAAAVDEDTTRLLERTLVCRRGGRVLGQPIRCLIGRPPFDIHVGEPDTPYHRSLTEAEWNNLAACRLVHLTWEQSLLIRMAESAGEGGEA